MFRLFSIVVSVLALAAMCPVDSAAASPYCRAGQTPGFAFGFAALAQAGVPMGSSLECEHANPANGDTLQQTSNGLSFYRKATNTPTFTDGFNHWALTTSGLVTWTGSSIDPPGITTTGVPIAAPAPVGPPIYRGDPQDVALTLNDFESGWILQTDIVPGFSSGINYCAYFTFNDVGNSAPLCTNCVYVEDSVETAIGEWSRLFTVVSGQWRQISSGSYADATFAEIYPPNHRVEVAVRVKNVVVVVGAESLTAADAPLRKMIARVNAQAR